MKVIMLKSVPKVGRKDQIVDVADGYAQHALFPKKFAIPATAAAVDTLKRRLQNDIAEKDVRHSLLDKAIKELNDSRLTMRVNANEQGNLFSKIHAADIATYLTEQYHIAIDAAHIVLPDGPIKKLGTYTVGVSDEGYTSTFIIELI